MTNSAASASFRHHGRHRVYLAKQLYIFADVIHHVVPMFSGSSASCGYKMSIAVTE